MPPPHTPLHGHGHGPTQQAYSPGAGAGNNAFLHTVLNTTTGGAAAGGRSPIAGGGGRANVSGSGNAGTGAFSSTQRSAQARGKEFTHAGRGEESYEFRQRREEAGRILDSVEMLIWWSGVRNESIPQTRHHFQNVVLGIEEFEKDVVWREEWEVEESRLASPRSAKGKEREKRRVSSGLGVAT